MGKNKMIYVLVAFVILVALFIYFTKLYSFNVDINSGAHKGIEIGMSRAQVLDAIRDDSFDYKYVTTNTPRAGVETNNIHSSSIAWISSQYWTLTKKKDVNLLHAFRISFEKNRVSRVEEWRRISEAP